MLLQYAPSTRQPQNSLELAEYFSLKAFLLLAGSSFDSIKGKVLNYPDAGAVPDGKTVGKQVAGYGQLYADDTIIPTGSETTFLLVIDSAKLASSTAATLQTNDASVYVDSHFNLFLPYTDNKAYFRWGNGEVDGSTSVSGAISTAQPYIFVCSVGPKGMRIWQNGKAIASNSATPSRTAGPAAIYANTASLALLCMWTRQFPDVIESAISRMPWEIFQRQARFFAFNAISSALPTLSTATYTPGSITTTGFRPRVTAS